LVNVLGEDTENNLLPGRNEHEEDTEQLLERTNVSINSQIEFENFKEELE
jgi:hypothetical protein